MEKGSSDTLYQRSFAADHIEFEVASVISDNMTVWENRIMRATANCRFIIWSVCSLK